MTSSPAFLDVPGLRAKGISQSAAHLMRMAKGGKFPTPVALSPRCQRWIEAEIDAWIQERVAARKVAT